MKKLFLLLSLAFLASCGEVTYGQTPIQIVQLSPFLQAEYEAGQLTLTKPLVLDYCIIHPFNTTFYAGGGIGAGANFNGSGTGQITGTIPVIGFVGAQISSSLPSVAIGGGIDLVNYKPIIAVNLNLYTFPISKPATKYNSLISETN